MPWRKVVPPPDGPVTWREGFSLLFRCIVVAAVLVAICMEPFASRLGCSRNETTAF